MGRKEKVISEVKINVVEQYLKGLKSTIQISSELNVNAKTVESWIVKYKTFGPEGLITQRNNVNYQPQVKHDAVIDYLSGKGSLRDICIKYKISLRSILQQWIKKYNGHKALKSSYTKGINVMTNGRKTTYEERVEIVAFCMDNSKNYKLTVKNILNREFASDRLNEKWLTGVIEFKLTTGKKAYLSAILDLSDKSIISYVVGTSNNNKLVFDTLDQAIIANPDAKPIFHSDRGFQYTNKAFKHKLDKMEATQSMSRVSRCIDNGPMEGFWGTLKSEMYYLKKFNTYEELRQAIDEYIEFYNAKRLQKKLKGTTPIEYRNHTLST